MSARDKFAGIQAEFWDCRDAEHLTHTDPISALEDFVLSHLEPGRPTEEVIREMGAITVEAFNRTAITESQISDAADVALDRARESLEEDLGMDAEEDPPMFTVDALARHHAAFEAAVRALAAAAKVHTCECAGSVELDPEETIELLRVERPEWFEPTSPAPAAEVPA